VLLVQKKSLYLALALLIVAPLGQLSAQTIKPAGVISIAPIEKILNDIGYIAETVGKKEQGDMAKGMGMVALAGVDMKRPAGVYVLPSDGGVKIVGFIPVTKLSVVLDNLTKVGMEAKDAGNGIKEIASPGGGMPIFVKEVKGWAFVSNDVASFDGVPADPSVVLGTLPKEYNLAVRVNVHDVPAELRQMAVGWIQQSMAQGLADNPAENPEDREIQEKSAKLAAQQITRMLEEVDAISYGWAVDSKAKSTHVDVSITAVDGTSMAKQMALVKDSMSAHTGFLQKEAAVTANGVSPLAPEDIAQYSTLLDLYKGKAMKEIDNDGNIDANLKTTAKEVVTDFFDVLAAI